MSESLRPPEEELIPLNPELLDRLDSMHKMSESLTTPSPEELVSAQDTLSSVSEISGFSSDQTDSINTLRQYFDDSPWQLSNSEREFALAITNGGGPDSMRRYSDDLAKQVVELVAKEVGGTHKPEYFRQQTTRDAKGRVTDVKNTGKIVDASAFLSEEASKLLALDRFISDKHAAEVRTPTETLRAKRERLTAQKIYDQKYAELTGGIDIDAASPEELKAYDQQATAAKNEYLRAREEAFSKENNLMTLRRTDSVRQDKMSPEGALQIQTGPVRYRGRESARYGELRGAGQAPEVPRPHEIRLSELAASAGRIARELDSLRKQLKEDPRSGQSAFSRPVKWYKPKKPSHPETTPEMLKTRIATLEGQAQQIARQQAGIRSEQARETEVNRYGGIGELLIEKLRRKLESPDSVGVGLRLASEVIVTTRHQQTESITPSEGSANPAPTEAQTLPKKKPAEPGTEHGHGEGRAVATEVTPSELAGLTSEVGKENLDAIAANIGELAANLEKKQGGNLSPKENAELIQRATNTVVGGIARKKYENSAGDSLEAQQHAYIRLLKEALAGYVPPKATAEESISNSAGDQTIDRGSIPTSNTALGNRIVKAYAATAKANKTTPESRRPSPADMPKHRPVTKASTAPEPTEVPMTELPRKQPMGAGSPSEQTQKRPQGEQSVATPKNTAEGGENELRYRVAAEVVKEDLAEIAKEIQVRFLQLESSEKVRLGRGRPDEIKLMTRAANEVITSIVNRKYSSSSDKATSDEQRMFRNLLKEALKTYESGQ